MDERVSAVEKVMSAMEELDHSELTRGNVKAAMRAVESMRNDLYKNKKVNMSVQKFDQLLMMAERGNWTELRNSRTNGHMPAARQELRSLCINFEKSPGSRNSVSPAISNHSKKPVDRGYPPQHTEESERNYNVRRREAAMEHRDRRSYDSALAPPSSSEYDRYELRQLDDPKQVSNQISRLASDRLRDGRPMSLSEVNNPRDLADMFADLYKHEWAEAYEELNKTYRDHTETINHLANIIKNAYEYCQKTADRQIVNLLNGVENEMLYPNITAQSRVALEAQVRPDRHMVALVRDGDDMIREFRKYAAVASLPVLKWLFFEEVLKTIHPAQRPTHTQVAFIDRCVELTWLMVTQATPMHLEFCAKGDRPSGIFRPFTRIGNAVQSCVWPALYERKDGTLIEKGVAHMS